MLYANTESNQKISATPSTVAYCPYCNSEMVPKCGSINTHHWAHKSILNCDPWYESETEWHRMWKSEFDVGNTEVILKLQGKKHIADYFDQSKMKTIEFQFSSISIDERLEREAFYPGLIWVFGNINIDSFVELKNTDVDIVYWWKRAKKSLLYGLNPKCKYFIDSVPEPGQMLQIMKFDIQRVVNSTDFGTSIQRRHIITGCPVLKEEFIAGVTIYDWW